MIYWARFDCSKGGCVIHNRPLQGAKLALLKDNEMSNHCGYVIVKGQVIGSFLGKLIKSYEMNNHIDVRGIGAGELSNQLLS